MIASKSSRFLARFFDLFVILLLQLISSFLSSIENGDAPIVVTLHNLISWAIVLYVFFADSLPNGQSLGKKVFKIAVVSTRTDKNCSILQSFIRNVIFAVPFGVLLECVAIPSDEEGRRIGDKLARTIVIKKGSRW
jgi:uncharacterized RDD family membrane protein YckC